MRRIHYTPTDWNWLLDSLEKRSAYQSWGIGNVIKYASSGAPVAEVFLKRAISVPLTVEECEMFRDVLQSRSSMMQPKRSDELIQAMFRVEMMETLCELYLKSPNQAENAQNIMLEARKLRKKYDMPEGSILAGKTQAASGQRVVEKEILDKEKQDESKPAYWVERARYYEGRKEPAEQEKALRKALSLFNTPELRKSSEPRPGYDVVYGMLAHFLRQNGKRYSDLLTLFTEQRNLAKDDPEVLAAIYRGTNPWIVESPEHAKEYSSILHEDMKSAVQWLKSHPVPTNGPDLNVYYSRKYVVGISPTMSFELLDFENDPFAWEFLNRQGQTSFRWITPMLFGSKSTPTLNQENLHLFRKARDADKLSSTVLFEVGYQLSTAHEPKAAIPFLKTAIEKDDKFSYLYKALSHLADCSLTLGDWRNGEKHAVECFKNNPSIYEEKNTIARLSQAVKLARKEGCLDDVKRINIILDNFGVQ